MNETSLSFMKKSMSARRRSGFSLTELAVALAVASFCLTSIVGLIPVGLHANQAATGQTFTNGIVSSVVADLRGTPSSAATSLQYAIAIPPNPITTSSTSTLFFATDGTYTAAQQSNSAYMVVITFLSNGSTVATDKTSAFANISINWPIPPGASASTKTYNSYQTFVGLDRN